MYELDCPRCAKKLSATHEQLNRPTLCSQCAAPLWIQLPGDRPPDVFDMELGPEPTIVLARAMPPPMPAEPTPAITPAPETSA